MSKKELQLTTIKFDKALHKRLAILAIEANSNMQAIVVEAVERLMASVGSDEKAVTKLSCHLKCKNDPSYNLDPLSSSIKNAMEAIQDRDQLKDEVKKSIGQIHKIETPRHDGGR